MIETLAGGRDSVRASAPTAGPRDRWIELGFGIVVIAVPLAFVPRSAAPFLDVKLLLLVAGCAAIWFGRPTGRRLAIPAAVWVAAAALAGLLGVDRWWSLTGPENTGNGLILLGASAFLLVAATGTPASIRIRMPFWLVGTATAVAAVALADRFLPGSLPFVGDLSFDGGTLGNPVFLAALTATAIVATVGLGHVSPHRLAPFLVILTSALALSTKRVGWIALAVGLAVALWRARPPRKRALLIVGVVAVTLLGWSLFDAFALSDQPLSGARRFSELTSGSARARVTALAALERGWSDRPMTGWGPGNTWPAYLSSVTESELRLGERGLNDAHNLLVEAGVTTGIVGLSAFLILAGLTFRVVRRGPRSLGWAAGGAAALAVAHLLQPVNTSLTPLFFLLAGVACCSSRPQTERARSGLRFRPLSGKAIRAGGGILLAGALMLTLGLFSAAILEQYGRTYASEWALRNSLRIAPGRVSGAQALALHLAVDGRTGDDRAAREAVALAARTVRLHPWHPGVRLIAADVHLVLRDDLTAAVWIQEQQRLFPADPIRADPTDPANPGWGEAGTAP